MRRICMTFLLTLATIGLPAFTADLHAQNDGGQQGQRGERGRNRGQRGGLRGGRDTGVMGLLRLDEVRSELQLTEDQAEAVQILGEELSEGRPEFPRNFREMSEEEQAAVRKSFEEWSTKQSASANKALATILEPKQFERLTQISIQQQGAAALRNDAVATKLKLTDEQQTKIAAAIAESRENLGKQMREAFQGGGGGDREAMRKKFDEIRRNADSQILSALTDEQKTMFEEMKGEEFAMPQRRFGGRRGGGEGRSRRNRRDSEE